MAAERRLYVGPSLRRLRRDHGLTQADMAADLEVSPSYIALLERNHRPLSAEMLLRLSQTYKMDMAALAGDGGSDDVARLQAVLQRHGLDHTLEWTLGAEPFLTPPGSLLDAVRMPAF